MEEIAKNLKAFLKAEFITGKSLIDWLMLSIGLLLQVIVIIISIITNTFEGIGLIISNLTGVIFVILCAQGKISSYLFHLIHIVTYIYYFTIPNSLWGEFIENLMYILADIIGVFTWAKLYYYTKADRKLVKIKAKTLGIKRNIFVILVFIIGVIIHYTFLKNVPMFGKMDSQPLLDSITSIPAYIGQILLVLGFAEQWFYWFILDFSSIFLAIRAGSIIMTVQFLFWTLNTIYGIVSWYRYSMEASNV